MRWRWHAASSSGSAYVVSRSFCHWLYSELLSKITIILSGVQIIIYLAGLQSISNSLYEAARVDSATEWGDFLADHTADDGADYSA